MHDPACQEALSAAQHLTARLFYSHDTRDFAAEARCFAEDGTWLRKGKTLRGRASIIAALEARPASLVTMHVVTNVVLEHWSADAARMSFFLTTWSHDDATGVAGPLGLRGPPSVGIGRAGIARIGGLWMIRELATDEWVFLARLAA